MNGMLGVFAPLRETNAFSPWEREGIRVQHMEARLAKSATATTCCGNCLKGMLGVFAPLRETNAFSPWEREGVRVQRMEARIAENVTKLPEGE